ADAVASGWAAAGYFRGRPRPRFTGCICVSGLSSSLSEEYRIKARSTPGICAVFNRPALRNFHSVVGPRPLILQASRIVTVIGSRLVLASCSYFITGYHFGLR